MSDAPNEMRDVKDKFKEVSKKTNTCDAFKVFSLGANGTCYVGCGLPVEHWESTEEVGVTYPQHQAVQTDDDGARVIFTWPVS